MNCVSSIKPPKHRISAGDEGVAGRNGREQFFTDEGSLITLLIHFAVIALIDFTV